MHASRASCLGDMATKASKATHSLRGAQPRKVHAVRACAASIIREQHQMNMARCP